MSGWLGGRWLGGVLLEWMWRVAGLFLENDLNPLGSGAISEQSFLWAAIFGCGAL